MKFDYLLTTSWSDVDISKMHLWAKELASRGHDVCIIKPMNQAENDKRDDVHVFTLDQLSRDATEFTPKEVEAMYEIPSLAHLSFTERLYWGLSHEDALTRGCKLAGALKSFFSTHSVDYAVQLQGAELHRLLIHYAVENNDGMSIWAGFSPFDETFSLQTNLRGFWDSYETIPYEEISEAERTAVQAHIEQFTEQKKRYTHETAGEDTRTSVSERVFGATSDLRDFIRYDKPGRRQDQIRSEFRNRVQKIINSRLLPSAETSRRRVDTADFVFFPLQYPVESRLTLFSPQYYNQEHVVEYTARALPSGEKLCVKPHPNHQELPNPDELLRLGQNPRIEFIHPELNAHEVIKKSDGVVVTNNTVGYETLYYHKPLIVLGNAPYAKTTAATTVHDMSTLPEVLGEVLGNKVPEERAIESIYSLQQAVYPGVRPSLDPVNAETVVDSVVQFTASLT